MLLIRLMFGVLIGIVLNVVWSGSARANQPEVAEFMALHSQTLTAQPCRSSSLLPPHAVVFCAQELRNDGNAPFVLRQPVALQPAAQPTSAVVVLLHGLSDSPFYLHSIAQAIHAQGLNVVVGLLPGHGLRTGAEQILHDNELRAIWRGYVDALIKASRPLGQQVIVGGFSTGGALAVDYVLRHPGEIAGLTLFSGALQLADNAESLSKIPFAKWLAKWMDGDYPEQGENPYKYPDISSHAALILMDIIRNIRTGLHDSTGLKMPIFVAHSQADTVTPIEGVRGLLSFSVAEHTVVEIAESMAVCHAAVPLNAAQVAQIGEADPNPLVPCDSPEANPIHPQMIAFLNSYLLSIINKEK
jgi:alpha-beta hydrolase superfamily lysophospholipase